MIGRGSGIQVVLRNNRSLLRNKRSFRELRQKYIEEARRQKTTHEKCDPNILISLRKKIKEEQRRENIKNILILIFSIAIMTAIIYGLTRFIN